MIVELSDHLKNPLQVPASRILIRGSNGTPVAFMVSFQEANGQEHIRVFYAGKDKDFEDQLRVHGFDGAVQVTTLDPDKMTGAAGFRR